MTAAQERDEGEPDFVVLADDDALDVGEDSIAGFLDLGHRPLSQALRRSGVAGRTGRFGLRTGPGDSCVVGG